MEELSAPIGTLDLSQNTEEILVEETREPAARTIEKISPPEILEEPQQLAAVSETSGLIESTEILNLYGNPTEFTFSESIDLRVSDSKAEEKCELILPKEDTPYVSKEEQQREDTKELPTTENELPADAILKDEKQNEATTKEKEPQTTNSLVKIPITQLLKQLQKGVAGQFVIFFNVTAEVDSILRVLQQPAEKAQFGIGVSESKKKISTEIYIAPIYECNAINFQHVRFIALDHKTTNRVDVPLPTNLYSKLATQATNNITFGYISVSEASLMCVPEMATQKTLKVWKREHKLRSVESKKENRQITKSIQNKENLRLQHTSYESVAFNVLLGCIARISTKSPLVIVALAENLTIVKEAMQPIMSSLFTGKDSKAVVLEQAETFETMRECQVFCALHVDLWPEQSLQNLKLAFATVSVPVVVSMQSQVPPENMYGVSFVTSLIVNPLIEIPKKTVEPKITAPKSPISLAVPKPPVTTTPTLTARKLSMKSEVKEASPEGDLQVLDTKEPPNDLLAPSDIPGIPLQMLKPLKSGSRKPKKLYLSIQNLIQRGILTECTNINSAYFEVLEFYGDAVLSEKIAFLMLRYHTELPTPHQLTKAKIHVTMNSGLSDVYDAIGLDTLIPAPGTKKRKADVVEAIIGELAMCVRTHPQEIEEAKNLLSKLVCFIFFSRNQPHVSLDVDLRSSNVVEELVPMSLTESREFSSVLSTTGNILHSTQKSSTLKQPLLTQTEPAEQPSIMGFDSKVLKMASPCIMRKKLSDWTTQELVEWIASKKSVFSKDYATLFGWENISGRIFASLSEEDMKQLGITCFGDRKFLISERELLLVDNK